MQWPDAGPIRFSVGGERCVLPFTYKGRTYNDCAALKLPTESDGTLAADSSGRDSGGGSGSAGGGRAAEWCPISGGDDRWMHAVHDGFPERRSVVR